MSIIIITSVIVFFMKIGLFSIKFKYNNLKKFS